MGCGIRHVGNIPGAAFRHKAPVRIRRKAHTVLVQKPLQQGLNSARIAPVFKGEMWRQAPCRPGLLKNHGVDKGPQPLMFNPALTTQGELPRRGKRRSPGGCASERMKTQRFSHFAGFAARRPAAAGQFRPVSRGGTSCFFARQNP